MIDSAVSPTKPLEIGIPELVKYDSVAAIILLFVKFLTSEETASTIYPIYLFYT